MAKGQCTQVEVQTPKSKVCKYNFCIRDLPREGRVSASELFCCQRLLILIHLSFYLCAPLIVAIYVFVPQLLCLPGTQTPISLTLLKLTLCQHPLSFSLSFSLSQPSFSKPCQYSDGRPRQEYRVGKLCNVSSSLGTKVVLKH